MKTLILLLISFSAFSQKLETSYLFIATTDKIPCEAHEVKWQLKNKRVIINADPVIDLDLKIIDRKVDKYRSWLGKQGENYYTITFVKFSDGSALLLIPVTKDITPILSKRGFLIGNTYKLCK